MAESYFTTLTKTGKAMFANSPVLGTPVSFSTLAVGDGNGSYAGLELAEMLQRTTLINEVWRGSINHISVHETNSNWLVVEVFIPSDVGDFDIREVGVFDPDNNLIAIGKYPLTYKPKITQGASKDLYIKMILEVTDTALVTLKVDPTLVLATRQHVADELAAYPEMVRKDEQGNVSIKGMRVSFHEPGDDINLSHMPTDEEMIRRRILERNGASLLRSDYPDLFAKIGTIYGAIDGEHFNLPDDRGLFFRILDHGAGIDPDAASRTDRGDGITGDNVGTLQASENLSHRHGMELQRSQGGASSAMPAVNGGNNTLPLNANGSSASFAGITSVGSLDFVGGSESRPINRCKWGGIFY